MTWREAGVRKAELVVGKIDVKTGIEDARELLDDGKSDWMVESRATTSSGGTTIGKSELLVNLQ